MAAEQPGSPGGILGTSMALSKLLRTVTTMNVLLSQSCFLWAPVLPENTAVHIPSGYFCVVQKGRLRRIPDNTTFNNLGFVVNEVANITEDQLGSMKEGAAMPHLDSRLLQTDGGKMYVMVRGMRRYVPSPVTLRNLGIHQTPAKLTDTVAASLPEGPPLPELNSPLVRGPDGRVYLIVDGIFRYIPDSATLVNVCVPQKMINAPADVIASLPDGPALPHNSKHCWNFGAN